MVVVEKGEGYRAIQNGVPVPFSLFLCCSDQSLTFLSLYL